jgi:hypothetical protein
MAQEDWLTEDGEADVGDLKAPASLSALAISDHAILLAWTDGSATRMGS